MSKYKTSKVTALMSLSYLLLSVVGCADPEVNATVESEPTGQVKVTGEQLRAIEAKLIEQGVTELATEYKELMIEGWSVMVSAAVQNDPELYQPIVDQLNEDLKQVKSVVPDRLLLELQKTVIWSEKSMPVKKLESLFFNGSRKLIKDYGLVPESYGGIILGKTKAYLAVASFKPWGMLHELTHAYHQFNIKHSFSPIKLAFENTKAQGLHNPKTDKRISGSGYPTRNQREYFSELTVAYFGKKLFYPHTRAELAEYDPLGYCAIVKAWGLQGKQQGYVPLLCDS